MQKHIVVLVGLLIASTGVGAQVRQAAFERISVRLPGYENPVVLDTVSATTHQEDVTRAAILFAARKAFEDFEIPILYADSTRGILLNAQLSLIRRLGKLRLSQIVDCGTNLNGAIADQYRVRMAVAIIADSLAPSATEYRIAVAAGGQSAEGASRAPLSCSTTGVLEERLAKALSAKIWGS